MKVNLGAGRRFMPGWVNVDCVPLEGIEVVLELDDPVKVTFPWLDDTVDEYAMIHVLEHIRHPLPLMEEAWRCAKPGASFTIACPYGSSDDADEDPTHVRRMFLNSFLYFSQPAYHRAQYNTKSERDVFGRRLHPNPLCPWQMPAALAEGLRTEASSETNATGLFGRWMQSTGQIAEDVQRPLSEMVENGRPGASRGDSVPGDRSLLGGGMHEEVLREGLVPSALSAGNGTRRAGLSGDQNSPTDRSGQARVGGIHLHIGSADTGSASQGTHAGVGTASRSEAASLGERASQERHQGRQSFAELGALVQTAALRSKDRGLAELARLLVPERVAEHVASSPGLGVRGCVCTYADYGYRGDWEVEVITLDLPAHYSGVEKHEILRDVMGLRNVVSQMTAVLCAVKPAREPLAELQSPPSVQLRIT